MSEAMEPAWLKTDLAENRRYVETESAEGKPASWINEDLSGQDLTGATLVEATLIDSDLSEAKLGDADLFRSFAGGARFCRASLRSANLGKATLDGADFTGAFAAGANFAKATLAEANLSSAVLSLASFVGTNARRAIFRNANLRGVDLTTAVMEGADFTGAEFSEAKFERTVLDDARFSGAIGIDRAKVISISVGDRVLVGDDARAWLLGAAGMQVDATAGTSWSIREFQLFLLSKMSGSLVAGALHALASTEAEMHRVATELGAVFDSPGHAAAEYRKVLGDPRARTPVNAPLSFAGSWREEYGLPLWPDVVFVVNEDRNGSAWGWGFEGGPAHLPASLSGVVPGQWSAERLRRLAVGTEVVEEWSFDLEAILAFNVAGEMSRFAARFDLGLLQRWERAVDS